MNIIYKIFFDKLNKNNSLRSKGSIEVYLRDNLKFLMGDRSNLEMYIDKGKIEVEAGTKRSKSTNMSRTIFNGNLSRIVWS